MTDLPLSAAHLGALVTTALWLAVVFRVRQMPRRRRVVALWLLILGGVPILGWLTLLWGPGGGVAAFALGLLILPGQMSRRRRRPTTPERHGA